MSYFFFLPGLIPARTFLALAISASDQSGTVIAASKMIFETYFASNCVQN
jgi:hypothetical protein